MRCRLQATRFRCIPREIRRRTRVVGAFPDGQSALNHGVVDEEISEHRAAEGPADERCHHRVSQGGGPLSQTERAKDSGHYPAICPTRSRPFHFRDFSFDRLRKRTPGPPPFSSMNSTPAFSKARLITLRVARRGCVDPASSWCTVTWLTPALAARSSWLHARRPRAALHCDGVITGDTTITCTILVLAKLIKYKFA